MHSNAVLLLFLGLPFDRALPWHKLLALSTLLNSTVHFIACYAGYHHVSHGEELAQQPYHIIHSWGFQLGMQLSGARTRCPLALASWLKPVAFADDQRMLCLQSASTRAVFPAL